MRATQVSLFFVLAVGTVAIIFHYKPPRKQAHLAALQAAVDSALRPFPQNTRFYFRADSDAAQDYGVWCRYFAAPRRLLLAPAAAGDTVFYLRPRNASARFSDKPAPVTIQIFIQP